MNLWRQWWARERTPSELTPGEIVCFVKSPSWNGSYGTADAMISALDATPLTHCAIVVASGDSPLIAHSTLAGRRIEPLAGAAAEHAFAPALVLAVDGLTAATRQAVADTARQLTSTDQDVNSYPFTDLFLAALLLRLRIDEHFDEHAHAHMTAALAAAVDDSGGRMCAAFLSDCYAHQGIVIAAPDEATGHTSSTLTASHGPPPDAIAALAAQLALPPGDNATRTAITSVAHAVAVDPTTTRSFTDWLLGDPHEPAVIAQLREALSSTVDLRSPAPHPTRRFTTVGDLTRSSSLQPAGHVPRWWTDPNHDLELEGTP